MYFIPHPEWLFSYVHFAVNTVISSQEANQNKLMVLINGIEDFD